MRQRTQTVWEIIRLIPVPLYIGIIICAFVYIGTPMQFPDDPIQITLDKDITLSTAPAKEEGTYLIRKGETVSYLGFEKASTMTNAVRAYVQTKDGVRGYFDAFELGFPVIDTKSRDTLTVLNAKAGSSTWGKVLVRYPDGTEKEISYTHLGVIMPKELRELGFSESAACYISEDKFNNDYVGHTLEECDKLNQPALVINREKDGTAQAYYNTLYVFKKSEGRFYRPMVRTDNASVITEYELVNPHGHNKRILKWLPFVKPMMDSGFLSGLINSSLYDAASKIYDVPAASYNWTRWLVIIFYSLFGLAWLFFFAGFILFILRTILICRYSFYHLNNGNVMLLFTIVAAISAYIWFALMLIWGLPWFLAILIFPITYGLYMNSTRDLESHIPSRRCQKCRRLHTMEFTNAVKIDEYDEMGEKKERGKLLDSGDEHVQTTWTETTYSNGTTTKTNVRKHYRHHEIYEMNTYAVLYHINVFEDHYNCSCCGNEETAKRNDRNEVNRTLINTTIETSERFYTR